MLVVMNSHATDKDIQNVASFIESKGFEARVSHGEARTVIHAIGLKEVDLRDFELLRGVDEVIKLSTNYKLAARQSQGKDTVVEVNGLKFGDKYTGLIAGPCTIESYDQMDETAQGHRSCGGQPHLPRLHRRGHQRLPPRKRTHLNTKKARQMPSFFCICRVLFEEELSHLVEAAAPGKEFVGCAL